MGNSLRWLVAYLLGIVSVFVVIVLGVVFFPLVTEKLMIGSLDYADKLLGRTASGDPGKPAAPPDAPAPEDPPAAAPAPQETTKEAPSSSSGTDGIEASAVDLRQQTSKRKTAIGKIKSCAGFIHVGGTNAYEKALTEMNTAQLNYNSVLINNQLRNKGAELDHAQEAIDLAFAHGLDAYDYLISKKVMQLKAASELDATGITPAEISQIQNALEEGRWLTVNGSVIQWLGGTTPYGTACWRSPSITATRNGQLWAHDRSSECAQQKELEKRF
jgi:hypothetical protein